MYMIWHAGDSQNYGHNSAGQYITGDNRSVWALPAFTIPSTVSEGTYRARLKIDWNTANACAINSTNEAPCVVDFMITVTYPYGVASADTEKVKVYATNEGINIKGYKGNVKVINTVGQLIKESYVNEEAQLDINAGFYIVVTGEKATEVVVK